MSLSHPFERLLSLTGFITSRGPADGLVVPNMTSPREFNRYDFVFASDRFPLKADALFRCRGTPVIIFKDVMTDDEPSDVDLCEWHALSWNFGLAPVLWVATATRVLLLNCYTPPRRSLADVVLADFEISTVVDAIEKLAAECGRLAFDTGAFWRSPYARKIDRKNRVDAVLLRTLGDLETALRNADLDTLLAQKLIGRTIFSQYLVDRNLLQPFQLVEFFGHPSLPEIFRNQDAAQHLFCWMKDTFNGDLFPPDLPAEDNHIKIEHLSLLAAFLEGYEPASGQRSLFPFRFNVIPVELISSIYEQFSHSAAGEAAAAQGLHYTPTNLVDLMLDLVLEDVSPQATVLDPACGSGVFLVESFRRLVWKRSRSEGCTRRLVRDVMHRQIFGVDINPGALQVTAFSLYLAALELDPELSEGFEWLKFDHLIGRSLHCRSFFESDLLCGHHFDVILGNPPWTYAGARTSEAENDPRNSEKPTAAQPRRTPDWAFLWRACRYAHHDTRIAFLMKATPFFSKDNVASKARQQMFSAFRDVHLINMAQLRTEGLFPAVGRNGATQARRATSGPALLFVARFAAARPNEIVTVVNVPWMQSFRRNGVFELAPEMFKRFAVERIGSSPTLLKAAVQGNRREFEVMQNLLSSSHLVRLGTWAAAFGIWMDQGFQILGGGRGATSHLRGLPLVDAKGYGALRLLPNSQTFTAGHAHRPRDARIYRGPLVLCPEAAFTKALERGRYSAAVSPNDVAYNDSFVGLSFCGHKLHLAQTLCAILNSKVIAFQLTFGGCNLGLKQPKVEKVDLEDLRIPDLLSADKELLERLVVLESKLAADSTNRSKLLRHLDDLVYDLYQLSGPDRRIVDDVLPRSRPVFLDTLEERIHCVERVELGKFLAYGDELTRSLDAVVTQDSAFRFVTNRVVRLGPDIVAVRFDLEKGPPRPMGPFATLKPELFEAPLVERLGGATLPRFHELRFLRIYADRTVYVVKPDEQRYWQISDAQTDAAEILEDHEFRRGIAIEKQPRSTTATTRSSYVH